MIPSRWLSESRHVGQRFAVCRQRGRKLSLGLGLGGCATGCTTNSSAGGSETCQFDGRTGGHTREARGTKSAPAALDKAPLTDVCPSALSRASWRNVWHPRLESLYSRCS